MKRIIGLLILSFTILFTAVLSYPNSSYGLPLLEPTLLEDNQFDTVTWIDPESEIVSYTNYKAEHLGSNSNVFVSFNTAFELFTFSQDVSYLRSNLSDSQKIELMSKNYVLGKDIDYGVMKARRFIPIGYDFKYLNEEERSLKFTGSFDGKGFEITNLYLAGHRDIAFDDENDEGDLVDNAISNYHAMFNFVEPSATIKNVGLINPAIDLDVDSENIKYFANLVGLNKGTVKNVYVIDNRITAEAGMRIQATPTTPERQKTAAGIVHTNYNKDGVVGSFDNAYFAGNIVVNGAYVYAIKPEPTLYEGAGTKLAHDSTIYVSSVNVGGTTIVNPAPIRNTGVSTTVLKAGTENLSDNWNYYKEDRYPALWGLKFNGNNELEINNAHDMITFTKLIRLNTKVGMIYYSDANYILTDNINFSDLAPDAYKVPQVEFSGTFNGNSKQISNLLIESGTNISSGYYLGLFSILTGTVKDLNLYNYKIAPKDYDLAFGQHFYVGYIAGVLDGGLVNNVYIDSGSEINLGTGKLGVFSVGSIAGEASGQILRVKNDSNIIIGTHSYNGEQLGTSFSVGGIVGSTGAHSLSIYNVENFGNIKGFSSTSLSTINNSAIFNVGGVIGRVENMQNNANNLGLLTNRGNITLGKIEGPNVTIHMAGVIGYSTGSVYRDNEFQGLWKNTGIFDINSVSTKTTDITKVAGIVVSNHNILMNYVQLFNTNDMSVSNNRVFAAALVYNTSTAKLNITHAKSEGNYKLTASNVNLAVGIVNENNAPMDLKYVEVLNDIDVDTNNTIEVKYAAVTLGTKVNHYNVLFDGIFNVRDYGGVKANSPLWIAGISHMIDNDYVMINTISRGEINVVANKSSNIYIGGLVNRNLSGNLNKDVSAPRTTTGIINSVNQLNISSTMNYNGTIIHGITGEANTFAGGIATMNAGSIQDSLNLGNIKIVNLDSYVSSRVAFQSGSTNQYGGSATKYLSGVFSGGIASIVTSGASRIYDTSNHGNIVALSSHYARAGGILAASLKLELDAGNISNILYSTNTSGDLFISNSVLSNGINYGSISAISSTIVQYSNNTSTVSGERPGIHGAAGGVIGYGLSEMYRMLNHGEIVSSDVAGGIVGATFVHTTSTNVTVYINTAINYGEVRAFKVNNYSQISKITIPDTMGGNGKVNFYTYNDTWLVATPTTSTDYDDLRKSPGRKRGFGGIFGRLQRGYAKRMTSENPGTFDFIANMNPNIDLIGRLDQVANYSTTYDYFRFGTSKFYSAKYRDMTQAVFVGVNSTSTRPPSNATVNAMPYISETQSTPGAQYVYDPAFEMRLDSTMVGNPAEPITSYIYYVENALLADRFRLPTINGQANPNYRANGMYVLSTSAGSAFGLVLPRNIKVDNFRTLKNNIRPDANYDELLNSNFNDTESALINGYKSLYQTRLNDKSALISATDKFEIKETGSSGVILRDPEINMTDKIITFTFYKNLFNTSSPLKFEIINANIPSNALIARTGVTKAEHSAFKGNNYNHIATGTDAPVIIITNPSTITGNNQHIGTFTSYSEAAVDDSAFLAKYKTEYTIRVNVVKTASAPDQLKVSLDAPNSWVDYNNSSVSITNNLGVQYSAPTGTSFYSSSYVMDEYVKLYYNDGTKEAEVDSQYYTIVNTLRTGSGRTFSFDIELSEKLRPGNYYKLGYKFYPLDTEKFININYTRPLRNSVDNLITNTGTKSNRDSSGADILFGDASLIKYIENGSLYNEFERIESDSITEPYLDNVTYTLPGVKTFEVSEFFDIENIIVTLVDPDAAYYTYKIAFKLFNNPNTVNVYVTEADLNPTYFKDGVRIPSGSTSITREASQTIISLDYNLLDDVASSLTSEQFKINPTNSEIIKTYENGVLRIIFTDKLPTTLNESNIDNPYNISVTLERNTGIPIPAGNLVVTKLKGTDAYLKDLRFSDIASETTYANIYPSNNKGVPILGYDASIYYAGIDYADAAEFTNFRVDGQVQKIPLDSFLPHMIEHMPIGASIQRVLTYSNGNPASYSAAVTTNTTIDSNEYRNLFGNFTIDPVTNLPVEEGNDAVISYRVTSEDGLKEIYYHITIVDIEYNVTLLFDYKYLKDDNEYDIGHEMSPLKNSLITVSVTNHNVNHASNVDLGKIIGENEAFPTFTESLGINTSVHMFDVPSIVGLSYRLARNLSGFYQIKVDLPNIYSYKIYLNEFTGQRELATFPIVKVNGDSGYYFYINTSTKLRTRSFTVKIADRTAPSWGLTDSNWQQYIYINYKSRLKSLLF